MVPRMETLKIEMLKRVINQELAKTAKLPQSPIVSVAGPSAWEVRGKGRMPVYAFEFDPAKVNASALVSNRHILHNVSTTLGGVRVYWKNSIGLCLVVDERPVEKANLLDLLLKVRSVLIVGPGTSGKTTLLQHYLSQQTTYEKVIVFDPKPIRDNEGDKWIGSEVIGRGGNYTDILAGTASLVAKMKTGGFGVKTLVIMDEAWVTNRNVPDAVENVFQIITLGAELWMDVFIGTHSERVKALGIEGEGDLRKRFSLIARLNHNEATGERWFTADYGKGELPAVHPGPFVTRSIVSLPEPTINLDLILTAAEKELVKAALAAEPSRSFSLGKLDTLGLPDWSTGRLRRVAEKFEKLELLTPGGTNEATGQWEPRQITDKLIELAK